MQMGVCPQYLRAMRHRNQSKVAKGCAFQRLECRMFFNFLIGGTGTVTMMKNWRVVICSERQLFQLFTNLLPHLVQCQV
jgi:hypothetical protein